MAQALYDKESVLLGCDFHLICSKGVGQAIYKYPKMIRNWITKQTSGCCGSNHELSKWGDIINECPNCFCIPETSKHTTRCQHEGRWELFLQSVGLVLDCLVDAQPNPALIDILDEYLSAQGSKSMTDYIHAEHSPFWLLATVQDQLGWDNFIK